MHFSRRHRWFVALLLLPGLLLRAAVPSGFMPGNGGVLGVTVVLCTAHGLQRVVMPVGEGQPATPAAPTTHHDSPCAFAMTAIGAPPPAPVASVGAAAPRLPHSTGFHSIDASRPDVRSQSPRGPPLRA